MTLDPEITPVVTALPGGGWIAEYEQEDGTVDASPLVGWLVLSNGEMIPMDVYEHGETHDPRHVGNFKRLYHPHAASSDKTD
jgi:hypothetical protein